MPRGRPKKINNLEENETHEIEIKPTAAREKSVTRIERYREPVEPEQLEIPVETPTEFEPAKHPFDVVLGDFGSRNNEGYIKVYRLPEYAKTGKASPRNVLREFCANIPVTPDYEQVIKENWGAGYYQLELRHEDGDFAGGKQICVAAPSFPGQAPYAPRNGQNPATVNSAQAQAIPYELPDPMAQMNATLDLIAKMRKSFGGDMQIQAPNGQPQTPELNLQNAISFIASQDEGLVKDTMRSFRGLIRGDGVSETTWMDLVDSAIKADLIPKSLNSAKSLVMEILGALNGNTTMGTQTVAPRQEIQNQTNGRIDPNNGVVDHIQTAQIQTVAEIGAADGNANNVEQQIAGRTMQTLLDACSAYPLHLKGCTDPDCSASQHIAGPAGWLMNEEIAYPFLGDLINMFIQAPTDQITTWVNSQTNGSLYTALPHWELWISSLQKLLKESTEDEAPKLSG